MYPVFLFFLYAFKRKRVFFSIDRSVNTLDYAIIVTAYQQTHLLPQTVDSILKLNYHKYHVYIVADNCDITNLNFSNPCVTVLRPEQVLASNTKSHFYAIDRFIRDHDVLTIIDSDNLVHPDYLNELNVYFNRGYDAIQGVRLPKSLQTTLACLDAARDIYYNYYDGHLLFELGSSATLAGSGMAFRVTLYRECLEDLEIRGAGFDKVLQAEIVKRGYIIAHAPDAIVYDEKTSQSQQLVNQRSRWINTWFKYCKFGGSLLLEGIASFNRNQVLFGFTLLRPPIFMFILLSIICLLVNILIESWVAVFWVAAFLIFFIGFFIALHSERSSSKIYRSLLGIPRFIWLQIVSLYHSRRANKRSIATKHL